MTAPRLNEVECRLNSAFTKSGMTPEEFFEYIVSTRGIRRYDKETLSFKVNVPSYGYDLEWYTYNPSKGLWAEG